MLWVRTLDTLWRIDAADAVMPGPARKVVELPLVNSVQVTRDGTLWVGANAALFRRSAGTDTLSRVVLPEAAGLVESVVDGDSGEVWVAVRGRRATPAGRRRQRLDSPAPGRARGPCRMPMCSICCAITKVDCRSSTGAHASPTCARTGNAFRSSGTIRSIPRHRRADAAAASRVVRTTVCGCWCAGELTRISPQGEVALDRHRTPPHWRGGV
ncbi:MAG: hypothetical protein IPP28_00120 [Xanthomonadales bacterium]|nr:hypothetical protein [Xanthomonadales bacterium]